MIQIRSLYSGWKEVEKEDAVSFTKYLMANLPAIQEKENKIKYINDYRLRGATVEELLNG